MAPTAFGGAVGEEGEWRVVPPVCTAVVEVGEVLDVAFGCGEDDAEVLELDVDFLDDEILWRYVRWRSARKVN